MMSENLFESFENVSSKQWKQKIQYELKGADYNDTLVWESLEGIKIKPFYHSDEDQKNTFQENQTGFSILQHVYVNDAVKSNLSALDNFNRGAEAIRFTIASHTLDIAALMNGLPKDKTYYFYFSKPETNLLLEIQAFTVGHNYNQIVLMIDPIGHLAKDGNWYQNIHSDFEWLNQWNTKTKFPYLSIDTKTYQNAGATMVQQLAYALAHLSEYANRISEIKTPITFEIAVGSHYFFEIAKIKALRWLYASVAPLYRLPETCHIIATPSKRNKTLYDYNVNMLRTTTECMSAILGGANAIENLAYDALYHKENEFGNRIARNQLLILKHESYLDVVYNASEGAYYIENITEQLAEKALSLFKDIESNGGFITQLTEGIIQRKISESAQKEQALFDQGKEILVGTNKYPNPKDRMTEDLELYPFVKTNPRKTLISPIIEKRLAEKIEMERLKNETNAQ